MKTRGKKTLTLGATFIVLFVGWTILIQMIDVKPIGVNGTDVGFSAFNSWFHSMTGVNMSLYIITDWLGLVPIFVCMLFGVVGFVQLIKRRNLFKVDFDIVLLGIYYIIVVLCYLIFEMIPINYRPVLINGFMEASYPSSTTLLVIGVMPTLVFQTNRRVKNKRIKTFASVTTIIFSVFMIIGRLISGVHWFTDIVGSVLFGIGLFWIYKAVVLIKSKE